MWRILKSSIKDIIENVLEIGKLNPATETFFDQYCIAEDEFTAKRGGIQEKITQLVDDIRRKIEGKYPAAEVDAILEKCSCVKGVVNARHEDSYSLVQFAIIQNRPDVLSKLLAYRPWVDQPVCGKPLHLACVLDNSEIVNMLLDYGANVNSLSCVCFPSPHKPLCKRYDQFSMKWVKGCHGDNWYEAEVTGSKYEKFQYPLYFAIQKDNAKIVKELQQYGGRMDSVLHTCCRLGSYQCLEYFLGTIPSTELFRLDEFDRTPTQHAIICGVKFIKRLVTAGANIFVKTAEDESLLHLLFKNGVFGSTENNPVHETLEFLLDDGLKEVINSPDLKGRTPLHTLLKRANRCVLNAPNSVKREDVMKDIKNCVTILVQYGASTSIHSFRGESCLHMLVNPSPLRAPVLTQFKRLPCKNIDLQLISIILPLLLRGGADINFDFCDSSLLSMLIRNALNPLNTNVLERYLKNFDSHSASYLDSCIDTLCKHGYVINRPRRECLLHIVLSQIENIENINKFPITSDSRQRIVSHNIAFTINVIESLLDHGVNPNLCKIVQSDLNVCYHLVVKHLRVVPFVDVISLILTFLVHGSDPNLGGKHMPMSVFRRSAKVHSPIFPLLHVMNLLGTKCSKLPFSDIWRLFYIFYSTMSDTNIRLCVDNYLEYDCYKFKNPKIELEDFFHDLVVCPRTLKQLCSRKIYMQMDRKLTYATRLPLPRFIIEYLKSCDW